jgi:hypothetical protein
MAINNKPFATPIDTTTLKGIAEASKLPPTEETKKFGIGQGYIKSQNEPVDLTSGSSPTSDSGGDTVTGTQWTLSGDPLYQQALAQGQSQFNSSRNQAMFGLNEATTQANQSRRELDQNSAEARRRLAGNYAARGMAGGAAGALGLAEAEANARQIAAQTSLKDKLAALNANFLENYGNVASVDAAGKSNYDWTGTLAGQQYKTQAAQTALTARLADYGVM